MVDQRAREAIQPLHVQRAPATSFAVVNETLEYTTSCAPEFLDITDDVRDIVERSGISFGQVAVFSRHTTAAIILNEHEPLLLNDMSRTLQRIAPAGDYYEHNDFSIRTVNMNEHEPANGHSHCQHLFLGASETIPLHGGALQIGLYQRLFLVELDHPRHRKVLVQAMGMSVD